ncbi:MAG: GNAT family N-acetyltransferase [Thermodesulfobacteriota bacterium]
MTDGPCPAGTATRTQVPEKGLGLNERLGLISLIDEGARTGVQDAPVVSSLFDDLWNLVDATVSGARIDPLKVEKSHNGFRGFEINAETGENLGRIHVLYLKKPIPCYYLVYVEVAAPYRRKGLGNKMLKYFKEFLADKGALGILDNIIPTNDPTYEIYHRHDWRPLQEVLGTTSWDPGDNYMVYVPPVMAEKDLREPVLKLVHHLKRKRAAIDMRDNETMVERTIAEFKELYAALLVYFDAEIRRDEPSRLMRYMFTRFVTKFIAFRRRIGSLLGYTGGESTEQIVLAPEIARLPVQSYAPQELADQPQFVRGDKELWLRLPEVLKTHPARIIEAHPNYRRPNFVAWLKQSESRASDCLTIGDLMELGFDPTRLKEITIGTDDYIFERIPLRQMPAVEENRLILERLASKMSGTRVKSAQVKVNPPLLVIRDRGNGYVLRRKIEGIHWEEAVEQLQTDPDLRDLNNSMRVDRLVMATVRKAREAMTRKLGLPANAPAELTTCFVSWDLEQNRPRLTVDMAGTFLETVWMA